MDGKDSAVLKIVVLYPELLGTYGDGGNGLVLYERARRRGIESSLTTVGLHDDVPDANVYLLGGGEDGPQRLACDLLAQSQFRDVVKDGAYVVAVCAGLQILGRTFSVEGNDSYAGLGLIDAVTTRGAHRSVGELAVHVGEKLLVGFENHGGHTVLGNGVTPLGNVVKGRANDGRVDGYRTQNIWATYAHGPVLAMNPWFCDEIIQTITGLDLQPLTTAADLLYEQRVGVLSPGLRG
jgi:lipid II isoglutaminyl synthase (glutamine-hydrolysing)